VKVVCAWCQTVMKEDPAYELASHGICADCGISFRGGTGVGLRRFLNSTDVPVLAVTNDDHVLATNAAGSLVLGKTAAAIKWQNTGVVIECERSGEGCGQNVGCSSCKLRESIQATHSDGLARNGVVSSHPFRSCTDRKALSLTFSTAKLRDIVIVAIERREVLAERTCALQA
jgi:hypothetical protein